jgi:hypothetical protein
MGVASRLARELGGVLRFESLPDDDLETRLMIPLAS